MTESEEEVAIGISDTNDQDEEDEVVIPTTALDGEIFQDGHSFVGEAEAEKSDGLGLEDDDYEVSMQR